MPQPWPLPCLPLTFLFSFRLQEQFQRNPDSYNGAVRENYTWSQDYTDLEVRVPVPKHVVKGKQVTALGVCTHVCAWACARAPVLALIPYPEVLPAGQQGSPLLALPILVL